MDNLQDKISKREFLQSAIDGKILIADKFITNYKADINNICDKKKRTIVHLAVLANKPEYLDFVLTLSDKFDQFDLFKTDIEGNTPLHLSLATKNVPTTKILIKCIEKRFSHEDIHKKIIQENAMGETSLFVAAKQGVYSAIGFFLKYDIDVMILDNNKYTAIHWSIINNHINCLEVFLIWKKIINDKFHDGNTILNFAINSNKTKIAEAIIKHAITYDREILKIDNDKGHTPLISAIITQQYRLAESLVELKANINHVDKQNRTGLIHAVISKHDYLVEKLLSAGADITVKDIHGKTALEYSKELGFSNGIDLIEEKHLLIIHKKPKPVDDSWVVLSNPVKSNLIVPKNNYVNIEQQPYDWGKTNDLFIRPKREI